jgi:3-ketosteroid 9alpha-monooxygenase subunit B
VTDEPLGSHVLELEVADVVDETADARSLVFKVPDGPGDPDIPAERLRYAPGQFLTLRVPSDRTGSVARCYSLCSSPFTDDPLTVTVKRTADGYASNWLCDHAHPGMKLHVLAPSGTFVPKTLDGDFLLLAAGSITPMLAILKSALVEGSGKVVLLYANRDEKSVIFGGALRDLAAEYPDRLTVVHWLETVQGLPDPAALAGLIAPYAGHDAYICGPGPFMTAAEKALRSAGTADNRIHLEVFKSLESDPFAAVVIAEDDSDEGPATAVVTLDGATHEVTWPRNATLLDVLLDKGLDAPFSCREGHCGACAVLKKSGDVEMAINDVLEQSDLDEGLILGCQALPRSESVEVTYDE